MSFGFMQKRAPWVKLAKCVGDQEERWWRMTPQNILDCQDICALCPARKGCGEQALIGVLGEAQFRHHPQAGQGNFAVGMALREHGDLMPLAQ